MRSDEQIIEGFLNRDEEVIFDFNTHLHHLAAKLLKRMGASDEDIEDIVQEAVVSLYTNLHSGDYTWNPNVKVSTYAVQICKYRWFNLSKRKMNSNVSLDAINLDTSDDQNLQQHIEIIERNNKIAEAMSRLKEQCQKILKLYYWEQKSMEEIGNILEMQASSVKNGKYRCMKQLKSIMDDYGKAMFK